MASKPCFSSLGFVVTCPALHSLKALVSESAPDDKVWKKAVIKTVSVAGVRGRRSARLLFFIFNQYFDLPYAQNFQTLDNRLSYFNY